MIDISSFMMKENNMDHLCFHSNQPHHNACTTSDTLVQPSYGISSSPTIIGPAHSDEETQYIINTNTMLSIVLVEMDKLDSKKKLIPVCINTLDILPNTNTNK